MDTSSINSHPSLVTARLAHVGRLPEPARSASETPARTQGISEKLPSVARTVKAPATLNAAALRHTDSNGADQDGQSMLEQLKADWGKADSPWDLNGDGTVDVRDFLRLLARMGGGDTNEPADPQTPIEQLLADWGKNDSRWDVNGGGTVNIRDFLQLLSKMDRSSRADDAPQERAPRVVESEGEEYG